MAAMQGAGERLHLALHSALQLLSTPSARGAALTFKRPRRADTAALAQALQSAAAGRVPLSRVLEDPAAEAEALAALTDAERASSRQSRAGGKPSSASSSASLPLTGDTASLSSLTLTDDDAGAHRSGSEPFTRAALHVCGLLFAACECPLLTMCLSAAAVHTPCDVPWTSTEQTPTTTLKDVGDDCSADTLKPSADSGAMQTLGAASAPTTGLLGATGLSSVDGLESVSMASGGTANSQTADDVDGTPRSSRRNSATDPAQCARLGTTGNQAEAAVVKSDRNLANAAGAVLQGW
jgi:hypothetical protein